MDTIIDLSCGDGRLSVETDDEGGAYLVRLSEPGGAPGFMEIQHIPAGAIAAIAGALFRAAERRR